MKRLRSIALLGAIVALGVTACDNDTGPVPGVDGVEVSPDNVTINVGETVQLSASVSTTGDASSDVTWSSSNSSVASVDSDGTVTGNAEGTATITATSAEDATKSDASAVTVVTPEPQEITISSYHAVSNEQSSSDGPVSSPDTVGSLCCEPSADGSPFTILQVTYDVDPGTKEIESVQMTLNGEVVSEQTISADQAAAFSHNEEDVTFSKNTLDYEGDLDGSVIVPDVPNGSYTLGGTVNFADGTSKTVTGPDIFVANHNRVIFSHVSGGNTAVDSAGDRWYGGTTMTYGVSVIDHQLEGASRLDVADDSANYDISSGTAGGTITLTSQPFQFDVSASANAGTTGLFAPVLTDDPRDADGESYDPAFQGIPYTVEYVRPFFPCCQDMLLDFAAPTVSGEIAVENADGTTTADGTQFFSSGVFVAPGGSDPGVGMIDHESSVFSVSRPVVSPTETWADVDSIAHLPERMEDDSVTLVSISDALGNSNTASGVATSPFGVDRTEPVATQDDSVGTAAMVLRVGPDSLKNTLLFSAVDPDSSGGFDATAGIKLITGADGDAFGIDVHAVLYDSTGATVDSTSTANATGGCCTAPLDWDRNDDGTNGDFAYDVDPANVQGSGFTAKYIVPDSATVANVGTLEIGPFAIDTGPPETTMIDPPSGSVQSSQNSLQFGLEARTEDGVNLDDITIFVETPGTDDDCTTRGDNVLLTEGTGPGNVDDNTVEVASDLDAKVFEFSNATDADTTEISFVIQNNETNTTANDGENQSICWVVSSSDDAQDNMGNPEPWTNDRITRTDIDWQ